VLEVPVRITVPDQPLPVFVVLRAQLTEAALRFDPPAIDYGRVPTNEAWPMQVRLTNLACVPQQCVAPSRRRGGGWLRPRVFAALSLCCMPSAS
jgi:hypothetical protein